MMRGPELSFPDRLGEQGESRSGGHRFGTLPSVSEQHSCPFSFRGEARGCGEIVGLPPPHCSGQNLCHVSQRIWRQDLSYRSPHT